MATGSVIGALKVVLGGDTSGLDKSLKDSQSSLASFGSKVGIGLAAVAAAATAAATALGMQVKAAIDSADHLNKMAQSTGVTTEELSKLKYAADLSDISTESLGKSMVKLSKALVAAGTDGASQAGRAFAAMGIDVKNTDGTLRGSSDVLKDLAEKFSGYKDGAEKTALAVALFGKAGAAMIPLLNQGRDGLEEAGTEAEKFGLVLDKKTTMAAEAFNDNLKKMDAIKQGLFATITAKMLPAFEMFSEQLLEVKKNSEFTSTAADGITFAIKFLVGEVMGSVVWFQRLGAEVAALWNALKKPWDMTRWADLNSEMEKSGVALEAVKTQISNLWSNTPKPDWSGELLALRSINKEVLSLADTWKTNAPGVAETEAAKTALQKFLDTQAKSTAAHNAEADSIGKSIGMQAQLKIAYEADAIAKSNNIVITDALRAKIDAAGEAAALAAMKVAGANATVTAMNPAQQFAMQMDQLRQLYDAGVISLETYGARQQQIAEQAGATWGIASASIAGSFATISGAFGKESSKMAMAAKVFGIIQGTISMFTGAAKALELPFPANIAAVAAVLAKGASLVASIRGQSVPTGMMTGGSMMVKGGGGPDSVPVNMMLSPGEQVDVWRPDQGGGSDPRRGAPGGGKTIIMQGMVWGRDQIRDLVAALNEGNRDGIKLEFA